MVRLLFWLPPARCLWLLLKEQPLERVPNLTTFQFNGLSKKDNTVKGVKEVLVRKVKSLHKTGNLTSKKRMEEGEEESEYFHVKWKVNSSGL